MEKKIAVTIDGKNIKAFCKHHKEERSRFDLYELPFYASVNLLTNQALDPIGKIPEYKVCAVKVEAA